MWAEVAVISIKVSVFATVLLTTVPIMVWVERRGAALIQDRLGPNRVGPWGILQPVVDAVKLIVKEDLNPQDVKPLLYFLAPAIALLVALSTFIVIPFGHDPGLELFGHAIDTFMVAPDMTMGMLYVFAIASLGVYAIVLGGWASNSKYALFGGIRSSAQMISYELAMTVSVVGVLMSAGSFHLGEVVAHQSGAWYFMLQPIGALTFIVAAFAETNRLPFDLPEAEAELVAGYHTEYSSMKFAAFFMSEYVNLVTASMLIVVLFFGGSNLLPWVANPFSGWLGAIVSMAAFALKTAFFMWFFVWVRWTLPRFRFDQLMRVGWKIMLPLAVLNFLIVGVLMAMGWM